MSQRLVSDIVDEYTAVQYTDKEKEYIQSLIQKIQAELTTGKKAAQIDCVQQLIFLNLIGSDTSWADFYVLEVMAVDDPSAKYISYTAATQMWNFNSDVVLMATNRILKDISSAKPSLVSLVLSSVPPYLSPTLAQLIFNDVIRHMSSSKTYIQQKAIMTFYHVCLHYPEALKIGFPSLRSCLDDPQPAVVGAALTMMHELCLVNPSNFVPLIPKIFTILESYKQTYIVTRAVQMLTLLTTVEKRLIKKLIHPYSTILDTTDSKSQLFDVIKSIVTIPIANPQLLTIATQRIESLIVHNDPNIRGLFTKLFIKLIRLQPKLLKQYRETVTQCLNSDDEEERLMALDLIASLVNAKSIASIVGKMIEHFKTAYTVVFRNQIVTKLITVCSQNDYEFISDFDWYIDVLMELIEDGGFTSYQIISNQMLDLALRVPSTRDRLVVDMAKAFNKNYMYKDSLPLLLASSHIIGCYSNSESSFEALMSPCLLQCNERVQQSFIISSFNLFIRIKSDFQFFTDKLSIFSQSKFINVRSDVQTYKSLAELLNEDEVKDDLRTKIFAHHAANEEEEETEEELVVPPDFNDPIPILQADYEISMTAEDSLKEGELKKKKRKKGKRVIRHQKPNGEQTTVISVNKKPTSNSHSTKKVSKRKFKRTVDQEMGKNAVLCVLANQFTPSENNKLLVRLNIENLTQTEIPSIDVKVFETLAIGIVSAPPVEPVVGGKSVEYYMKIEIMKPMLPNIVKVVFSPVCGNSEVLETKLKIFPSLFLQPVPQDTIDAEKCKFEESITVEIDLEDDEIIKLIAQVLRTAGVKTQESEFRFYATATFGVSVIGQLNFNDDDSASLSIKTGNETFTEAIMKEIEMRLRNL